MPSAEKALVLGQTREKVWETLQNLGHWEYLLRIDRFIQAFKPRLIASEGLGPGKNIALESGRRIRQVWTITEWVPPERFTLVLLSAEPWPAPRHALLSLAATVPAPGQCRVSLRAEFEFRIPVWGPALNATAALVGQPGWMLGQIADRLPRLFEE